MQEVAGSQIFQCLFGEGNVDDGQIFSFGRKGVLVAWTNHDHFIFLNLDLVSVDIVYTFAIFYPKQLCIIVVRMVRKVFSGRYVYSGNMKSFLIGAKI